jgi:multidrug efflux system membrane fusion protein
MFSPKATRVPISLPSIVMLMALGLVLSGCSEEKVETKEIVRPVKVVVVADAGEARKLDYSGSVKARTEMNLVAGKITERHVNIGDRVEPGDLLARIDPTDYQLAVTSAEANLVAAEKQVETTGLAKARADQLFAKNVTSKSQLEEAALAQEQAVSARDAAIASLDQAKNQVRYTDLRSDQSGIVTAVNADIGQVIGAGSPVVAVAVDGEKEAEIAVPEMDIAKFRPGQAVTARFWSDAGLVLAGKVREVAGSADRLSRTFAVRVSLPNDQRVLLGMTATIETTGEVGQSFISVPLSALSEKDGKKVVWVVKRETGTVHAREIVVSDFSGDGVNVTQGLKPGDIVVAAGTQFMSDNLKVKLPATEALSAQAETGQIIR